MQLSAIDLRHIRIFLAVVECGGFSAAEGVLGLGQSTISTHIAELERRLGYRLCERGRAGFSLTERGVELHDHALRLVDALSEFEEGAQALKGILAGHLRLALIDNLISDPHCPVTRALASLAPRPGHAPSRGPRISIDVLSPAEIERAVAVGRIDVGITIAERQLPALRYQPLYVERDILVCGRSHPLFAVRGEAEIRAGAASATKVVRSFLNHQDFFLVSDREETIRATVTNLEAAAFLVLAGSHIGFLPEHYARRWIEQDAMRAVLPDEFNRMSEITLVRKRGSSATPVIRQFLKALDHGIQQGPLASHPSMPGSKLLPGTPALAVPGWPA
ncbi:LysR family transcriptional regulator [Zavarzinia sp. CC-PAN008]|uniref:LysR family transcriptional regulator n=1 Tax=Zavarzinia sp. CC-PAN008 TaxID=3243332 RepID=UPI003F74A1E5